MTHGYQWIQEIPIRHIYPDRDRYEDAPDTTQPNRLANSYTNGTYPAQLSTGGQRSAGNGKVVLQRRGSARSDNGERDHSHTASGGLIQRPIQPNYTLVLKSSPKPVKKPAPVYNNTLSTSERRAPSAKAAALTRTTSNPFHRDTFTSHNHHNIKRSVSDAENRALGKSASSYSKAEPLQRIVREPLQSNPVWENSPNQVKPNQNGHIIRSQDGTIQHNIPYREHYKYNPSSNQWEQTLVITDPRVLPASIPTPSRIVQENFVWKDEKDEKNQPEKQLRHPGTENYYSIRRHPKSIQYYDNAPVDEAADQQTQHTTGDRGVEDIPFTKKTGKDGQERFLQLMKATIDQVSGRANHRKYNAAPHPRAGVYNISTKPPPAPTRRTTKKDETQQMHQMANGVRGGPPARQTSDKMDGVIYTEVIPQTWSRKGQSIGQTNKLRRERSPSPVIYTEVIPSTQRQRTSIRDRSDSSAPIQYDNQRASMTFGDDFSISPSDQFPPQNPLTTGAAPLAFTDPSQPAPPAHNTQLSQPNMSYRQQAPTEFSISLGTPRLQLRRNVSDVNNNQTPRQLRDINGTMKPFPTSASLDQMLSDTSSSKKSSGIKSALKQPSHHSSGSKDIRSMNKSPKRVTIKESSSGRTTPSTYEQMSYIHNPASGIVRARTVVPQHGHVWNPLNRFKISNKNVRVK